MPLYIYIKAPRASVKSETFSSKSQRILSKFSSLILFSGVGMILFVLYPIASYRVKINLRQKQETILSPVPESLLVRTETVSFQKPKVLASQTNPLPAPDLEMVSNWFPTAPLEEIRMSRITDYTISIPKLKIYDAHVKIGGKKLKETLIQYGGTALPGEYGNPIIFGHSALPQFFNPKDYKTIFSTIPELEKGDEIIVDFDGIRFVYLVERYFEIEPTDVEVLEQRFDRQVITLITCVPPGTYWKRGVVRAYLQKI